MCQKVFKFLLGGRILNENHNTREWMEFYNCQIKPGDFSETPFLVATTAIHNKIKPIALSQQWALFGRFFLKTAKSVDAEKTVGQVSTAQPLKIIILLHKFIIYNGSQIQLLYLYNND